jgi:DNA polymerase-3 subunit delta'
MSLHPVAGHEQPRGAIARAFAGAKLPKVFLLHGPKGVGKQRLALWVGQLALCAAPTPAGPCGVCQSCRLALRVEHPDLLWYFPVKRPPPRGSKERDQEGLEEARIEGLRERRQSPLRAAYSEELTGLQIGTIRNLRKEALRGPALATRRVFVVADAEELVAQDASPEAANALLKILEEPPAPTWFVLTASEPGRVPATVRSRATSLYMPALRDAEVSAFLVDRLEVTREAADAAAHLAQGSIGRALGFLPLGDEPVGPLERIRRDAEALLAAALSPRAGDRFARALAYPPAGARGLGELFSFVESGLRDLAAGAAGVPTRSLSRPEIRGPAPDASGVDPRRVAGATRFVEEARKRAASNVNPQLLVNQLLADLHEHLFPHLPQLRDAS